jgi:energy-converting hydrogenase B subunit D
VNAFRVATLILLTLTGPAVVTTREPLKQTMVLGVYGLVLVLVFFSFQAPDVALSAIVVSTVGLPVMILLALRKLRELEREIGHEGGEEP